MSFDVFESKTTLKKQLFMTAMRGKIAGSPDSLTIFVLRPSETKESRETFVVPAEEWNGTLKMVKVRTPKVAGPVGIIVYAAVDKGRIEVEETVLRYENGRWQKL